MKRLPITRFFIMGLSIMRLVPVFVAICFSATVAAEDYVSPAELLQEKLAALSSFTASFEQTTLEEDGFLLDEQRGKLYFSRPSRLRWESIEPFEQTLVADGVDIYLYDPDLNQVTVRAWSSDPLENPAAIFVTSETVSAHFSVNLEDDVFVLTPFSETSSVLQLKLGFDDGAPSSLQILDTLGQRTEIVFSEQNLTAIVDAEMFQFTIPDGAEVITDG